MGFTKKTWKNRIAEYINRRRLTMEDGSTSLVTVARDEGTISQEGDAFNAANMNDLEDRIEAGFEEINRSLTWKKIGTATGSNSLIADFSKYNELRIVAKTLDSIYTFLAFTKDFNTTGKTFFNGGAYISAVSNNGCVVYGTLSALQIVSIQSNGNVVTNNATLTIYGR